MYSFIVGFGKLLYAYFKRVGPVWHLYAECFLYLFLVEYGEVRTFHRTWKLLAVARVDVACVTRQLAYQLCEVVP